METKELRVDRIENGMAVAYDKSGREYCLCGRSYGLSECDVLLAKLDENGEIADIARLPEKTARAKASVREKIQQLFEEDAP